jgi:hypothetical protein
VAGDGSVWVRRFPENSFGVFDARLRDHEPAPQRWIVFDSEGHVAWRAHASGAIRSQSSFWHASDRSVEGRERCRKRPRHANTFNA